MRRAIVAATILVAYVGLAFGATNLVTNAGFEDPLDYVVDWPNEYARWGGDMAEAVTGPHNGIAVYEAQAMLRFEASNATGYGETGGCQVVQVLDISEYLPLVSSGDALASASVQFNRVSGDAETDTEFAVRLYAYSGTINQHFALKEARAHLLRHDTLLFSDSDPATWEVTTVEMWLPANTDFLTVEIAANEDIYNDLNPPEFDGHYADYVVVTIVPEPTTLGVFALCGLGMLRRRHR